MTAHSERDIPAEYRALMRRLNHAETGHMTLSDICFLKGLFEQHWWRVPLEDRDRLTTPKLFSDPRALVERLQGIADKCGV